MTYLQFHFAFTLPAILMLKVVGPRVAARDAMKAGVSLLTITTIAFVYTTPWDNYLVETQVWGYGPGRVLGTVGHVPIEEYLFFILQPLLTGLWLFRLLWREAPGTGWTTATFLEAPSRAARWAGVALWLAASVWGLFLLAEDSTRYLALILVWAAPVIAFQWAYGGHHLWRFRRLAALAVAVPTLYLWVADWIALALGIWHISETYTTGLALFGLPIEEALFFLVTNILVVQGLLLMLHTWKVPSLLDARPVHRSSTQRIGDAGSASRAEPVTA
ncbi:MAG: lycopene cyclase domain-containing protein [Bacteroidota bacterium]